MAFTADTQRVLAAGRKALEELTDQQVRELVTAWANAWDVLEPQYQASIDGLLAAAKDGRVTSAQVRTNTKLKQALELTLGELEQLAEATNQIVDATIPQAVNLGGTIGANAIATQLPPGQTGLLVTWDSINPDTVAAMVQRTTEQIHASTWPLAANAQAVMKQELLRGITVGSNPMATARRIMKRAEGAFNGGLSRAMTIARTETLDAHRAAGLASSKLNREVLTNWRWFCHLGGRTCAACLSMHGREFELDEFGPEGHQNCRCTRVETTKTWRQLGFDIDEPKDTFPDSKQWYDSLTPDSQAVIMGKKRRDLLADGEISWESLASKKPNSGWRDSYVVTPLKDLT